MKCIFAHPHKKNVGIFRYHDMEFPIFLYEDGIDRRALHSMFDRVFDMLKRYSKVTTILFTLHPKTSDLKIIESLMSKIKRQLHSDYESTHIAYCWVREKAQANPHYHLVLMLSGHVCRSGYAVLQKLNDAVQDFPVEIFVYLHKRGTFHLSRTSGWEKIKECLMRMSYGAKKATKDNFPKKTKRFGFSRLVVE